MKHPDGWAHVSHVSRRCPHCHGNPAQFFFTEKLRMDLRLLKTFKSRKGYHWGGDGAVKLLHARRGVSHEAEVGIFSRTGGFQDWCTQLRRSALHCAWNLAPRMAPKCSSVTVSQIHLQ